MKPNRTLRGLLALFLFTAACHDGHDDDNEAVITQGDSEKVDVVVFADTFPFPLDECISAEVVSIYHEGEFEEQGENIEAFVDGVVEQHDFEFCETEIRVNTYPDTDPGTYEVEVQFLFEDIDGDRGVESAFVEIDVVRRSGGTTRTRTPTRTPVPAETPTVTVTPAA